MTDQLVADPTRAAATLTVAADEVSIYEGGHLITISIKELLGNEVYAFAYPNGDYSEREVRFVEKAGYKCAVSLEPGSNSAMTPQFRLRRFCIPDDASLHELIVKTSGLWHGLLAVLAFVRGRYRSREKALA